MDKKKIYAEGDVAVMGKDWRWKRHSKERRGVGSRSGARRFSFQGGDIRAVLDHGKGAVCISCSDGAVEDEVVLEDVTECFFVWAAQHTI